MSCAVLYAGLYYGWHEQDTIIPRFGSVLPYFKCFVDDMLGIWIGNDEKWEEFKSTLKFGSLEWTTTGLNSSSFSWILSWKLPMGKSIY
jgi:hypothetical protein